MSTGGRAIRVATTVDTAVDAMHMRRVLDLAEQYRGRTSPNPIVGCVIVDPGGKVIAEGVHQGPGMKHAEADALAKLGGKATGATLYVNLEPCTHQGRTPPCMPLVKASGVARVVVGTEDPVPGHGGGMEALRRAKISVARSLVDECDDANLPFLTWAHEHRAAFTLKAAITLDGKIATVTGESKWITGEAARADGHHLRDTHDAVLVGIGTVLADDPLLTARLPGARDPIRIIVDSQLRTPTTAQLLAKKKRPRTIIATTSKAPDARERALVKAGAEIWRFKPERTTGQVPLAEVARKLGDLGILSVLVEGGGQVHASLLRQKLADEVILYIAPKIVGGPAPTWVGGKGIGKLADAHGLRFTGAPLLVGDDIRLRAVRA